MSSNPYGGIEAGGTKFSCAIGTSPGDIQQIIHIPTTTPSETLSKVVEFFKNNGPIESLGLAAFGPIEINKKSPNYGHLTSTPKEGWRGFDLLGYLKEKLNISIYLETDVQSALRAEHLLGAGQGIDNLLYITVGGGIGGASLVNGHLLEGLMHQEIGHMFIPKLEEDKSFDGVCHFHNDCWEGLSSGPSIETRWGKSGEDLGIDHNAWELEAKYLAYGIVNALLVTMPERIIVGGGVMKNEGLIDKVRLNIYKMLNGYIDLPSLTNLEALEKYIVLPSLGSSSGILGALMLARSES